MKNHLSNSIMPNEKVVLEAKFSIMPFIPSIIILTFFLLMTFTGISTDGFTSDVLAMLITGIVIAALCAIPGLKKTLFCELAVTDKKILGKTGFIKTAEMNSPIQQVQNVAVSNGLLGKIFKYGTLDITTTSGQYVFFYVKNPNEFKKTVMKQFSASEENKMDLNAQKIADAVGNKFGK